VLDGGEVLAVYAAGPGGAQAAQEHARALNSSHPARNGTAGGLRSPAGLRAWRQAYGLTQGQLAELLEVRVLTVQRWEAGSTPVSRVAELALERLGQELGRAAAEQVVKGNCERSKGRENQPAQCA